MTDTEEGAASVAPSIPQDWALRLQLALIAGNEPPRSYYELRGLKEGRIAARRFVPVRCPLRTARYIRELADRCDVYIGCAPRTSNTSGTLKDIARVWCLWCDCDSRESSERLYRFRPAPSIVVRSGSPGCYHAYWPLSHPLTTEAADRANRRIMKALGADNCGDPTRVLRPIGSINHKRGMPVVCVRLQLDAFSLADVVGTLEDDDRYKPPTRVPFQQRRKNGTSGLVASVATAPEGNRNKALYWAARRAEEEGTLHEVRDELSDAAVASGLNERGVQATLLSAERAA